jgi:hypothetical protein
MIALEPAGSIRLPLNCELELLFNVQAADSGYSIGGCPVLTSGCCRHVMAWEWEVPLMLHVSVTENISSHEAIIVSPD